MKARNGKVARLPIEIREQLNIRLADGEPGNRLAEWLNSNPVVTEVMAEQFAGRPITEHNISEWRQGGYEEWRTLQTFLEETSVLFENSADIAATGMTSHHLHTVLLAHHARLLNNVEIMPENEFRERLKTVTRLTASIMKMRRSEQNETRLQLQRERLELRREIQNLKSDSSVKTASSTSANTSSGASETQPSTPPRVSSSNSGGPSVTGSCGVESVPPPNSALAPNPAPDALFSALMAKVGLEPVHTESVSDYLDSVNALRGSVASTRRGAVAA